MSDRIKAGGERRKLFQLAVKTDLAASLFYMNRLHTDVKVLGMSALDKDMEDMIAVLTKYKKALEKRIGQIKHNPTSGEVEMGDTGKDET